MDRRYLSSDYNALPYSLSSSAPAPQPAASLVRKIFSLFVPDRSSNPAQFSVPSLQIGELLGGVSNTIKGLVLNDNWWILLLIIFLFFPSISRKMFRGILKD